MLFGHYAYHLRNYQAMNADRMARVNELMRQEISSFVQRDFEFPHALVTINAVEITPDLREGKVFVGVIGNEIQVQQALDKLAAGRVDIQSHVSKRVKLRLTPKLSFQVDKSAEKATSILSILDELADEEPPQDAKPENS